MTFTLSIPDASDPMVALLAKSLWLNPEIRQAREVPAAEYSDTPPIFVPVQPMAGARPLKCWFNVRDAIADRGGRAVFGWSLWARPDGHYQAIHHGVWEQPSGSLVDITPMQIGGDSILFMADARVPFDYGRLRAPASYVMFNDSTPEVAYHMWVAPDNTKFQTYVLLRMEEDN
nr:hypothetical protein [uncultured Ralstonia sp.]